MVVTEKLPEENSFGMDSIFFASPALISITLGTLYQKRFATQLDIRTGAVIQFISALTIFGLFSLFFRDDGCRMEFRINLYSFLADPSSFDWSNSNFDALDSVGCDSQCGKSPFT